jgi:hypothetical protein
LSIFDYSFLLKGYGVKVIDKRLSIKLMIIDQMLLLTNVVIIDKNVIKSKIIVGRFLHD